MSKNAIITVNNYQLGVKVCSMPTHKIIRKERVDRNHTVIEFEDVTSMDIKLIGTLIGSERRINIMEWR